MRAWKYGIVVCCLALLASCEDVIDIDLNDGDPRVVIEAEINNLSNNQEIRVSRTVSFTDEVPFAPVSGAQVIVSDERGQEVVFVETAPGVYATDQLRGAPGRTYHLDVTVDGVTYEATSTMPVVVPIDSVSSSSGEFFGVSRRVLHVHFQDPPATADFFRYRMSVNESPFFNVGVFNDKFNNGRYVTHDLISLDIELQTGDEVIIVRNQVDERVYRYWFGVVMLNPGAATPSNPPSNISGGALGYFSAQTLLALRMTISDELDEE